MTLILVVLHNGVLTWEARITWHNRRLSIVTSAVYTGLWLYMHEVAIASADSELRGRNVGARIACGKTHIDRQHGAGWSTRTSDVRVVHDGEGGRCRNHRNEESSDNDNTSHRRATGKP